jgi:hypothetical protein
MDRDPRLAGPAFSSFDGERGNVDSGDVEALLREPNGIGSGAASHFQRPARLDSSTGDELDELRRRMARVPGKLAVAVVIVPRDGFSHGEALELVFLRLARDVPEKDGAADVEGGEFRFAWRKDSVEHVRLMAVDRAHELTVGKPVDIEDLPAPLRLEVVD